MISPDTFSGKTSVSFLSAGLGAAGLSVPFPLAPNFLFHTHKCLYTPGSANHKYCGKQFSDPFLGACHCHPQLKSGKKVPVPGDSGSLPSFPFPLRSPSRSARRWWLLSGGSLKIPNSGTLPRNRPSSQIRSCCRSCPYGSR